MTARAALLTPPGQGAIATIAVTGPDAWGVLTALFRRRDGKPLPDSPRAGQFWLGRLGEDVADEVVLAVPRLSPETQFEVHCHGGTEVVRFLLELLASRGVQPCHERPPLLDALAHAPTVRTAAILLDQHQGAWASALEALGKELDVGDVAASGARLAELLQWAPLGSHLTEPWRVALAGAPNAGKSTLMNALAGYRRSIVAPTPGTTRDVVTVRTALEGWPVEFADTAGLREGAESLEQEGIARAREAAESADLVVWVVDATAAPVWPAELRRPTLVVLNKTDLPPAWHEEPPRWDAAVSAATGSGVPELCRLIATRLVPEAPPPGQAVPWSGAVANELQAVAALVGKGDCAAAAAQLRRLSAPWASCPTPV